MQEVDIVTLKGVLLFTEKKSYLVVTKFYYKDIVTAKRQCKNLLDSGFCLLFLCVNSTCLSYISNVNFTTLVEELLSKQIDFVDFVMKIVLNFKFERTESSPL